ncbi:MAG: glycosyltransferase family A protein [Maribacter sp.]|uniref:glycosyltransferase family A protein n=1 Tax=Maribacter sp. TaxID=1897614 RepID=UPI00329A6327
MEKTENVPIVVVAYNRASSLDRLLNSLSRAHYPDKDIKLIISIDHSADNQDVLEIANNFQWEHGSKEIDYQKENLGLRRHIIKCGLISEKYGNVIVLEDDLYVAKHFYFFATEALKFVSQTGRIAGVSLYNHQMNQHNFSYFSTLEDGYDNWYFQYGASWGQAWSEAQFKGFHEWYLKNEKLSPLPEIPLSVRSWSDKSWLKFFIAYMIENDKYFLYPKTSFTTNFGDSGTHSKGNSMYQVPLSYANNSTYNFSSIAESSNVYDAFFENQNLHKHLKIDSKDLTIDLYGIKSDFGKRRFVLTSKLLDYKIIQSFGRSLKPHEANILDGVSGQDFFLYDTQFEHKNVSKKDTLSELLYTFKGINYQRALYIFIKLLKQRIKMIF